jgi:hypothetical protein
LPQSDDIIILDFNIDHSLSNKMEESFSAYDFKQMISEPTRVTFASQKIIDVIYANNKDAVLTSGVICCYIISVFCKFNFCSNRIPPKVVTYRDLNFFSVAGFTMDLKSVRWDNILYLNNIDDNIIHVSRDHE